jgi:hypothetical protein
VSRRFIISVAVLLLSRSEYCIRWSFARKITVRKSPASANGQQPPAAVFCRNYGSPIRMFWTVSDALRSLRMFWGDGLLAADCWLNVGFFFEIARPLVVSTKRDFYPSILISLAHVIV